jgi:hypothetical protein
MKPPVFIIGNPRSGTTLLRLMITSHRAIVVPPECGFAIWWRQKYSDWTATSSSNERAEKFVTDLVTSKKFETWNLSPEALLKEIQTANPADYAALVSVVYIVYACGRKPGFSRWGDKNNFHVHHVNDLLALFPRAQFVHIIRDGRDVACSYRDLARKEMQSAYAPRLATDISAIANEWRTNVDGVRAAFSKMAKGQGMELRYEDLVGTSEATLRELCAFLGEDYDPQMLEYHVINRRETLEPKEFLQWKQKTLQAPDRSALGKFREELTAQEIAAFEKIAAGTLNAYHYSLTQ